MLLPVVFSTTRSSSASRLSAASTSLPAYNSCSSSRSGGRPRSAREVSVARCRLSSLGGSADCLILRGNRLFSRCRATLVAVVIVCCFLAGSCRCPCRHWFSRQGGKPCRNGSVSAGEMIRVAGAGIMHSVPPALLPCAVPCCHH